MSALCQEPRRLGRGILEKLIGPEGDLRNPERNIYTARSVASPTSGCYPFPLLKPPTTPIHIGKVEIPVAPLGRQTTKDLNNLLSNLTDQEPYLIFPFRNVMPQSRYIQSPPYEGALLFREGLDISYALPDGTVAKTDRGLLEIYVILLRSKNAADGYSSSRGESTAYHVNGNLPPEIKNLLGGSYVRLDAAMGHTNGSAI